MYVVQGNDKEVENDIGSPDDIALGRSSHIYVLDGKHKKVHVLNGDATYIRCFGFPHLTSTNYHPPKALVVNSEEKLYFADDRNHCVHVLSSSGEYLFKFGKCGSICGRGTLSSLADIAVDSEDYVFVASTMIVSVFDRLVHSFEHLVVKEASLVNSVTSVACTSVEVATFMLVSSITTVCRYSSV